MTDAEGLARIADILAYEKAHDATWVEEARIFVPNATLSANHRSAFKLRRELWRRSLAKELILPEGSPHAEHCARVFVETAEQLKSQGHEIGSPAQVQLFNEFVLALNSPPIGEA